MEKVDLSKALETSLDPGSVLEIWGPSTPVSGQFQLLRQLGAGAMGEVFLARDFQLGRRVAIKTLRAWSELSAEPDERKRTLQLIRRDAANTARLNHPGIVQLYQYGVFQKIPFMVLEYVPGVPLDSYLERNGPLNPGRAIQLATSLADAIAYAHSRDVLHRDLKPANLMVTDEGDLKVLDFGVGLLKRSLETLGEEYALTPEQVRTYLGDAPRRAGTPAYMAPEQAIGALQDERVDVWAFGVILYEMLIGDRPYHGFSSDLPADFTPMWPTTVAIPRRLTELVQACLKVEQPSRIENFEEVLERLGKVVATRAHASPAPARINVSAPNNEFVGRSRTMERLDELVGSDASVITLLGPGGIGKTRSVKQWAVSAAQRERVSSVIFVDLTEATTREGVAFAVAQALPLTLGGGDPVDAISTELQARPGAVVILDNCEQVIDELRHVLRTWRESAPDVTFVATSRLLLRLGGERIVEVEPLGSADAIALFTARAAVHVPDWTCPRDEVDALEALVEKLDGMPLAIELAASRARSMSPRQILDRMNVRFRLLQTSQADAVERHMSLRTSIEWSWDLLNDVQRAAWQQISAFEGGFRLEHAEEVVDLSEFDAHPFVMDVLDELVGASILRFNLESRRFDQLGSLQEFGRQKLDESGMQTEVRMRHASYFAKRCDFDYLSSQVERHLSGLAPETDNVSAAMKWCLGQRPTEEVVELGLCCAAVMSVIVRVRGPFSIADRLETAIMRHPIPQTAPAARAMATASRLFLTAGRLDAATRFAEIAAETGQECGDRRAEANGKANLAICAAHVGDHGFAREHIRQAIDIAAELGDLVQEISWSGYLGYIEIEAGNPREARVHYSRAAQGARERGDDVQTALFLQSVAYVDFIAGRLQLAETAFAEALDLYEATGYQRGIASCLGRLGYCAFLAGDEASALDYLTRAETISDRNKDPHYLHFWRGGLALIHHEREDFERAAMLIEDAISLANEASSVESAQRWRLWRGVMSLERGELQEADREISDVLERALDRDDVAYLPAFIAAKGRVELARGDHAGARRRLDEAVQRLEKLEFTDASLVARDAVKLAADLRVSSDANSHHT